MERVQDSFKKPWEKTAATLLVRKLHALLSFVALESTQAENIEMMMMVIFISGMVVILFAQLSCTNKYMYSSDSG